MANRTSRHLDFLVDHLKIVHVACIFVDFRIADHIRNLVGQFIFWHALTNEEGCVL
jgi:hypothetical protein